MKNQANTNLLLSSSFALAMTLATWLPSTATAADEPMKPIKGGEHQMMGGKIMTETNMMQRCQAMKEQKEKMAADMKSQDAELTAQVAKMNLAPEDRKLGLAAAVVTQMVEQRTAMHARMAKMQAEMMMHMMGHMEMGKESMAKCPMMKGMDEKSDGAHAEHHEKSE